MKQISTLYTKIKHTSSNKYQKHFSLDDRILIQKIITENRNEIGKLTILLKDIGKMLKKDPSSISKEVKLHRVFNGKSKCLKLSSYNSICAKYLDCKKNMDDVYNSRTRCKNLIKCVDSCNEFEEFICPNVKQFPWVCNGCRKAVKCCLNKYYYYSDSAHKDYKDTLVSSREGINITPDEFKFLNHIISTYILNKQPIHHIMKSNDLPVSERTVYNYFEKGLFNVKNVDLRRKVVYKKRYSRRLDKSALRTIKLGRTYEDYLNYIHSNPDASIVEMDTVISAFGSSKVLLTLHFVKFHFQLAYLLPNKNTYNVISVFNSLYETIGHDSFSNLFEVILTDNGSEFSDPFSIEFDPVNGIQRAHLFYCNPYNSGQKGHCEKNHEYIRYFLPRGSVFESLTQDKVSLMMSHINSTIRPSVKGSPYDYMALTYGIDLLVKLGIKKINSHLVTFSPQILTK